MAQAKHVLEKLAVCCAQKLRQRVIGQSCICSTAQSVLGRLHPGKVQYRIVIGNLRRQPQLRLRMQKRHGIGACRKAKKQVGDSAPNRGLSRLVGAHNQMKIMLTPGQRYFCLGELAITNELKIL